MNKEQMKALEGGANVGKFMKATVKRQESNEKRRRQGTSDGHMSWGTMTPDQKKKWIDTDKSVAGKKHVAYSPDGFTITREAKRHDTYSDAHKELTEWATQYKKQGHYRDGRGKNIPYDKIVQRSRIKAE